MDSLLISDVWVWVCVCKCVYGGANFHVSLLGNPRRRVHQTEQSGFKLFRPTTRDLLLKPQSTVVSPGRSSVHPTSNQSLSYLLSRQYAIAKETTLSPRQQTLMQSKGRLKTKGSGLPELFIRENTTLPAHLNTKKTTLHLPNIVRT